MNTVMLRRAIIDMRRTTLWFTIGASVYIVLIGLFYPSVRDSEQDFQELLEAYPEGLLRAVGMSADDLLSDYSVFVSAESLSLIWPIIAAAFIIMTAGALVAQEIERGTVEYWLSVPEQRWRLLLSKYVALLLMIAGLTVVSVALVGIMGVAMDGEVTMSGLVAVLIAMLLFSVTIASYTTLLSAMSDTRSRAAGLSAAITTGMYLLYVVSQISSDWEWLRFFSIFAAYQPQSALQDGTVGPLAAGALIAVSALTVTAALVIFQRRDIIP